MSKEIEALSVSHLFVSFENGKAETWEKGLGSYSGSSTRQELNLEAEKCPPGSPWRPRPAGTALGQRPGRPRVSRYARAATRPSPQGTPRAASQPQVLSNLSLRRQAKEMQIPL